MISLDKKVFKGDFKHRLGNDMSLSGGDMRVQNSAEKEELKALTKPRSITNAGIFEAQLKNKKPQKRKSSNTKLKLKEL